jgi:nicotinamide riboside kinase
MAQDSRSRICLIGPESTGKSQLARRLARELGCPYVAEYARAYAEVRGNDLSAADVEPIARGCLERLPDSSALVLDTDLISTVVYARYYYGACPSWIEDEARRRRADIYFLLDTDIEWKPDPARDNTPDSREDLFDAFRGALDEFETRWQIVSGTFEERWRQILAAVRS